jgi:hypothetical protein
MLWLIAVPIIIAAVTVVFWLSVKRSQLAEFEQLER